MYFVIVGVPQQVGSKLGNRLLNAYKGHQFSVLSYKKIPPRLSEAQCALELKVLSSTLYKICSRPRPENLVCGDFVQSFLEG